MYVLYGGAIGERDVAYVGEADVLVRRVVEQLVVRDPLVLAESPVVALLPFYVVEVRWWLDPAFANAQALHSAELIASELFDPPLRGRSRTSEQAFTLYVRLWAHNGGDPYLGRRLRAVLAAAGFGRTTPSPSASDLGTRDPTGFAANLAAAADGQMTAFAEQAVALGWTDREALAAMSAALRTWGARPDAFKAARMGVVAAWVE